MGAPARGARRKLRLFVEGCLDSALASWLARRSGFEPFVERVGGGWTGVVRSVLYASTAPLPVPLGFIDADESARDRLKDIERLARRYASKRGLKLGLTAVSFSPMAVKLVVEGPNTSRRGLGFIVLWCRRPWADCDGGSVEDVLWDIVSEVLGCSNKDMKLPACKREVPTGKAEKLLPVYLLGVYGSGSLVESGYTRHCCGVPVEDILRRDPAFALAKAAEAYAGLLRALLGAPA